MARSHKPRSLSPRQTQILFRRARGQSCKEIAAELGISLWTVKQHMREILKRSAAHSSLEAVYNRGLVKC